MSHTTVPLTLFYDAACPVCSMEMDHLRERDHGGRLRFVDISAAGFDAASYGTTAAAMDAEIHGLLPDGTMLRGVEVLRRAYEAVGLGWVLKPTGWAPLTMKTESFSTLSVPQIFRPTTSSPLSATWPWLTMEP